jgi:mannosyltransferase
MDTVKRHVASLGRSRVVRFGIVGVINTVVDFSIFNTLVIILGWPIIPSNIIAATTAMIVSFFLNKKTVFRSQQGSSIQIVLFFVFTLTGIWIVQNGVISLVYPLLGSLPVALKLNLVKVLAVIIGLLWNYASYSTVVFNERRNEIPAKLISFLEKHWAKTIIIAILAVAIMAIMMGLGKSMWFDENYSIILAQRPINEIIDLTKVDAHPPLYYLYLKAWGSMFGWTELALRLSSIIPTALSIGIMAAALRRLFSPKVALVTLPFLATAPLVARYAYEIRMYPIVLFIGVLATYVLLWAKKSGSTKWWLGYAILVTIGMYTLYMSIVIWIGHALWLMYCDLLQKKNVLRQKQWLFYLLAIVLFLPWLPTVIYQLQNSALPPYMTALDPSSLVNSIMLLFAYTPSWNGDVIAIAGTITTIILLTFTLIHIHRSATKKIWQSIMLFIIVFFSALVFYFAISTPPNPPRFTERYILHISIYLYALIGVTIAIAYKMKFKRQAMALGIVSLAIFVYGLHSLSILGNYNFQRLQPAYGNAVRADIGCDNTTIVTSGAYGYIDMWYEFQGCDFKYYQPVDLTYTGGYAPINKLNATQRIKQSSDLSAKKVAFVYYDDSTEFISLDSRYKPDKKLSYIGLHVDIYQRD